VQKLRKNEKEQVREESAHDAWFNEACPMKVPDKTWREKSIEREACSDSEGSAMDEGHAQGQVEVNMVFVLPAEFRAPEAAIAKLVLGAKAAKFEKPGKLGEHMKPMFTTSHVEGRPVWRMMVNGGVVVNVMPISNFEKLGCSERELIVDDKIWQVWITGPSSFLFRTMMFRQFLEQEHEMSYT
jgi:hypothetical protein